MCGRACVLPAPTRCAPGGGCCAGHSGASLQRRASVMDDTAMVMSGSRQSLIGTHDGVDGTAVLAPHGGGLPALETCAGNREGGSSSGQKKSGSDVEFMVV
jgi:hypothetical protein